MEFKLTIGATPELLAALSQLTAAVNGKPADQIAPVIAEPKPVAKKETKPAAKQQEAEAHFVKHVPDSKPPAKQVLAETKDGEITMESLRARVVALTQAGKKDHLKRAVGFYGAVKLSDVAADNWENLAKNLTEIENGVPLVNHAPEDVPF